MTEDINRKLKEIFSHVGKEYGYDNVEAEFMVFTDLKVRWQRTYRWADFKVSDYLEDAPEPVLIGLAHSLFSKIKGESDGYSQTLVDWVTRPEFSRSKAHIYMERNRNLCRTPSGSSKDLRDAYDRLIGAGLVPNDPTITLTWTEDIESRKLGCCSVLMRVVGISKLLDRDDVPDFVLDYCLYHELCHIQVGYDPNGVAHEERYRGLEDNFPTKPEAVQWMRDNCAYV